MVQTSKRFLLMPVVGSPARKWFLHGEQVTIGRDESNDIVLEGTGVSRRHAMLHLDRGRWILHDQGSRNGTFVNGQRVLQPWVLQDNEEIRIGDNFRLFFLDAEVTMPLEEQDPSYVMPFQQTPPPPQHPTSSSEHWAVNAYPGQTSGSEGPNSSALHVDQRARRIWISEVELLPPLSASQYALFNLLYQHAGEVVSREDIAKTIWPKARGIVSEQAIDSLIRRLRRRIAAIDSDHVQIITVRGHGVRLELS